MGPSRHRMDPEPFVVIQLSGNPLTSPGGHGLFPGPHFLHPYLQSFRDDG